MCPHNYIAGLYIPYRLDTLQSIPRGDQIKMQSCPAYESVGDNVKMQSCPAYETIKDCSGAQVDMQSNPSYMAVH